MWRACLPAVTAEERRLRPRRSISTPKRSGTATTKNIGKSAPTTARSMNPAAGSTSISTASANAAKRSLRQKISACFSTRATILYIRKKDGRAEKGAGRGGKVSFFQKEKTPFIFGKTCQKKPNFCGKNLKNREKLFDLSRVLWYSI